MTDVHPEYQDSCGLCYELACDSTWTSDGYGQWLDRTASCFDTGASVVVRIVDVCPCSYPSNAYNNKRWCCGDRDHFDVSVWAFEKLAETRWGVIPIKYRPVPCDHKPYKPAPPVPNPTPEVTDGRTGWSTPDKTRHTRDWPEYMHDTQTHVNTIFEDNYGEGIHDASWNMQLQSLSDSIRSGTLGSPAICGKVFKGALEFWTYVGYPGWEGKDQKTPDLWVSVSGNKATNYFWGWQVYLPIFNGWPVDSVINNPYDFTGCGGNSVWDLHTVEFRNDGWSDQWVCLDRVRLV